MDQTCNWTEDIDGLWATDCGHVFEFHEGGPENNGFQFCPWCGRNPVDVPCIPDPSEGPRQLLSLILKASTERGDP